MNKKEELLIGKTLKEAAEILRNCEWRIVNEDGKDYMLTMDLHTHRYNLYIESGIMKEVKFF